MVLAALLLQALAAGASPSAVEVLPDVNLRLGAARYIPADTDFGWEAWIGAGAGLLRVRGATAYFTADVETIVGNERRAFDANQANYHLEAGVGARLLGGDAALFFNHVSRHYADRPKEQAVDWNELGVRYGRALVGGARPLHLTLSVGRTTLASLVGYEWIATAELAAEPVRKGPLSLLLRAGTRAVTVDPDPALPRGSFLDGYVQAGPRFSTGGRVLDLFAAAERRNDVFLEVPGSRDRVVIGLRISYLGR
jgi:hypothetical protein